MQVWQHIARQARSSACSYAALQQGCCQLSGFELLSSSETHASNSRAGDQSCYPHPQQADQIRGWQAHTPSGQHHRLSIGPWLWHPAHQSQQHSLHTCATSQHCSSHRSGHHLACCQPATCLLHTNCYAAASDGYNPALVDPKHAAAHSPTTHSPEQLLAGSAHLTAVLREATPGVLALHPDLNKALLKAHREQAPIRLQALLDALPSTSSRPVPLSAQQLDDLLMLSEVQLVEVARDCGFAHAMSGADGGTPGQSEVKEVAALLLHELVMQYGMRRQGSAAAAGSQPGEGMGAGGEQGSEVDQSVQLLTQSLWDDSLLERVRSLQAGTITANTTAAATAVTTTPRPAGLTAVPQSSPARPTSDILVDPGHPYAPAYDEAEARRRVAASVKRLLRRARLSDTQPADIRQLKGLKKTQLQDVCSECGIHPPMTHSHTQLALCVAGLVAQAQGMSIPIGNVADSDEDEVMERRSRRSQSAARRSIHEHVPELPQGDGDVPATAAAPELLVAQPQVQPEQDVLQAARIAAEHAGSTATGLSELNGAPGVQAAAAGSVVHRGVRAARAALMSHVAAPHQVAEWLQAARAQNVVLVEALLPPAANQPASGSDGRPTSGPCLLVGTAVSARHATACAEAVRWHVGQRLAALCEGSAPGSWCRAASEGWRPGQAAGLNPPSDWVAFEAGPHLQVHILTEPARWYYQLEAKKRQTVASHMPGHTIRATHFKSAAPPVLTLDTITAESRSGDGQQGSDAAGFEYLQSLLGLAHSAGAGVASSEQVLSWTGLIALGRAVQHQYDSKGDAQQEGGRWRGRSRQVAQVLDVQVDVMRDADALQGVEQVIDRLESHGRRASRGAAKGLLGRRKLEAAAARTASRRPLFDEPGAGQG